MHLTIDPMPPQQQGSLIIDWDLDMDPPTGDEAMCTPCACRDAQVLAKDDLETALRQSVLHTLQLQNLLLGTGSRPAYNHQRPRTASSAVPGTARPRTARRPTTARKQGTAPHPQTAKCADPAQSAWKGASWGPGWDCTRPHERPPRQQPRHSGQLVSKHCRRQRSRSEQGRRAVLGSVQPSAEDRFQLLAIAVEQLSVSQETERAASQAALASFATDLEVRLTSTHFVATPGQRKGTAERQADIWLYQQFFVVRRTYGTSAGSLPST